MNTHLGICNRLFWMQDTYPLGAADRVLQKTPYSFDVSVWEFFWPLQVGATLVVARPQGHLDSRYLAQRIQQDQITTIHFVPSMLQIFLGEKSIKQCAGLKRIICSGEALPVELANQCRQILPAELHNLYGPTEAAVDVSSWACPKQIDRPRVPIGRPISNTALYILDSQMAPLPVGVPGELHIGGICLARGYHNRPDLTASRFVSDPFGTDPAARLYKTGDLARYLPDGDIEYLGRLDHQVKIRGFRIELEEIEHVLGGEPGITDCVVHVCDSAGGEAELVAYYVTPADRRVEAVDSSRLRDRMRRRLPEFMVPTHFVELQAIPLSPNGKVDRQALPVLSVAGAIGDADHPLGEVEEHVAQAWRTVLGLEEVGRHDNFFDLGGHSLRLTRVHRLLEERFGDAVPGLIEMFQLPTVRDQALAISPQSSGAQTRQSAGESADPRDSMPTATTRDIAVIGMACRFPGAPDPAAFWRNLRDGVESITFFTDEELLEAGIDAGLLSDPRYVKANSIVPDADRFDAEFFSFSPRDAEILDPQHRLLLECSWESLESAGYDPLTYAGHVGVFAGCGANSYILNNLYPNKDLLGTVDNFQLLLANDKDYLSTRISYKLNLTGPSLSVQTACSTSLVAVSLACRSLIEGHCDMALAGGATLSFPQQRGYLHKEGMIFSSDGHCRAFDADADGMVGGNGAGAVLLKPLDAALADGDNIVAVIKGSALNNDGANKIGYTAPSEAGQARVIEQALATYGIEPESIGYVETHGTGTALGDPIEIAALARVHAGRGPASCAIGSVKTNMGHLDAAAGIAGFMKAALCLQHGQIPPSLHYHRPNPRIDFASTPFHVATELQDWPRPDTHPRRAGVSSFGIGGTNAHVILEEPPPRRAGSDTRTRLPFVVSARTPEALRETREQLRRHLAQNPTIEPGDLAFTLAVGRHGFETRGFTTASTTQQLLTRLEDETPDTHLNGNPAGDSTRSPVVDRQVAFMFPGQGAQWAGMGRELYETEPVFREQLDLCTGILLPLLGQNLLDVLFSRSAQGSETDEALQQTRLTQPALFAVEYSLAQLWLSWGLTPDAMIGHSIGEYVAACLAGVFSLEDALRIVQERAHLMQLLPGGSMLAVRASEEEISPYLGDTLDMAVRNTPTALVLSGAEPSIRQLNLKLEAEGILSQVLRTSHAFHSRMMEPVVEPFLRVLSGVDLQPPSIRFISNVTGDWITAAQATDASYWATHLRETVRFGDGLSVLLEGARYALLEVGPGRTLQGFVRGNPTREAAQLSFASMLPPTAEERRPEDEILLNTLGGLWLEGVQVDWSGYFSHERRRRIPLPTYPFQRARYWIDPPAPPTETSRLAERLPLEQWFWSPTWKQHRHADAALDLAQTRWLLFLDDGGLGATLAARLQSAGARVATVSAGSHFEHRGQMQFAAEPGEPTHYRDLLKALQTMDFSPSDILHLWPLSSVDSPTRIDVDRGLSQSFYSLVELAQALGEAGQARLRIHNVTSNLFSVLGEPLSSPLAATALGPVEVIPKEYEGWVCRNIDIDLLDPPPSPVDALWEECIRASDKSVALRAGYRWVRVFDQLDFQTESSTPVPIRQGATYLITGGLGGIGFVLARHLAQTARANLVLIGRAGLPDSDDTETSIDDRKLERLEQLRSLGTRVDYYSADVTHPAQMADVIRQAEAEHGDIRGVIHAAGVAAGGVIQQRSRGECAAVIAPKVQGALVLQELFQTRKADFIFLCSSTSAVLGEFGQVDYAAANLFQDVLASRSATEGPWICSVNWDTWAEIGMAAETEVPARLQETRRQILATGITCDEGTRVFERVLASRLQHVVVSTRNFQARLEHEKLFSAEAIALSSAAAQLHARPELSSEFKAPESPTQTTVAGIWQNSLGIRDVGIDDDFFELGGDSLLATQVISRIRDELGVALPMPSFFNHPTLAGVADSIDTVRWVTQAQAGSAQTGPALGDEQRETFEL
jgi:acyl transferase domain-containing protein/acyl carrier protein